LSGIGVHSFQIPHEFVQPTRDMIIIRIPMPPRQIGSIITADITRDLMQHNVMAGRIVALGPLAFNYKSAEGLCVQEANLGDWVIIRPFAGTMIQGGKLAVNSGWRYVSSFQDVIGVVPAADMPEPSTLIWNDDDPTNAQPNEKADDIGVRERIVYPGVR
jgi:hypothetical protein